MTEGMFKKKKMYFSWGLFRPVAIKKVNGMENSNDFLFFFKTFPDSDLCVEDDYIMLWSDWDSTSLPILDTNLSLTNSLKLLSHTDYTQLYKITT